MIRIINFLLTQEEIMCPHPIKEYLIAQATMKATGANIHKLNNIVSVYCQSCIMLETDEDLNGEIEAMAIKAERILEGFSMNGNLK